jgi:hypothetical protein
VPPGSHPTWHDQDHRPTPQAAIATTAHQGLRRRRTGIWRPENLAVTESVPMQTQTAPGRSARTLTSGTHSRAGGLDRWGLCEPPLDVEPAVNDE